MIGEGEVPGPPGRRVTVTVTVTRPGRPLGRPGRLSRGLPGPSRRPSGCAPKLPVPRGNIKQLPQNLKFRICHGTVTVVRINKS